MIKSVYGLFFEHPNTGLVIFYVGCTNDISRRWLEHYRNFNNEKHTEFDTYKYRFCRELASEGIDFFMEVVSPAEDINDEADEYSWILKFARHNEEHQVSFYGSPLTNMRAGDFLSEMIRDRSVNTAGDVRRYTREREQQRQREINYTRGEQPSPRQYNFWGDLKTTVDQQRAQAEEQRQKKELRQQRQTEKLAAIRREQEQEWLRTGKILGEK